MKKINVRSPFFITVQREAAKVVDDPCITDINGLCIDDDPCITDPTLPQCAKTIPDPVFNDRNLICGASVQNIGIVGAMVYNFDIETTGRVNGDYTVSLNDINIPVRIRMDVVANVPKKDLGTGTAFENKGLTTHSDTFEAAGYGTSGLTGTPTDTNGLDITKTFAYNSSSHTGNLRFQLHLPVVTENSMTISVSCPAKATVTTVPDSIVTIVSFSSLNVVNPTTSEPFAPLVKVNGAQLGNIEILQKNSSITNEKLFQSNIDTIMGVGRFPVPATQQFSTRRFMQAETDSGAAGTGLTLPTLLNPNGIPHYSNRNFFRGIPNGNTPKNDLQSFDNSIVNTQVIYKGNNFLSDGTNLIEVLLPTGLPFGIPTEELSFQISISKHIVKNLSTETPAGLYIRPPSSNEPAETLVLQGTLVGALAKLTFAFEGNNNTDLLFDPNIHGPQTFIENPMIEELINNGVNVGGYKAREEIDDPNTTFKIQKINLP